MTRKTIKYIAFYSTDIGDSQNRAAVLSATNKINYICSALRKNGYDVEIISPSWTNNNTGVYRGETKEVTEGVTLKTFATFGSKNKFMKFFKYLFSNLQLYIYLLKNTKRDEPIIVYHSVFLSFPIRVVKLLKKFNLILEVEEIYKDVQSASSFMEKSEFKLFEIADKFIFPTELLNEKINLGEKPFSIIYGTYQVEDERECKFDDNQTHVVYAGTFEPSKGSTLAIAVAEYLPENYHMHLIGFGTDEQVNNIKNKIELVSKKTKAYISYNGLLQGEEYIRFLQKCDIGLSPQVPNAGYNETSFPSKILSYLANGLSVVSVRIKSIEKSAVDEVIFYYDKPDPKEVASRIVSIDLNRKQSGKELIKKLDREFVVQIKQLLEI
ncbi:glycosyltransferase [Robertmurraya korlensis]|uniref:glycosyltransferase n=1 Tax=Robertmurraya korlensis TaxID=519977 RepID=UPI00082696A1|nr:glycosyltransferase [Robertmurraya korlensis]